MRRILLVIFALAILVGLGLAIYYWQNNRRDHELVLYGNVDVRQVDIGFRVPGQVEMLCYQEGDVVKAGDLLATLNYTPYISEVSQSKANVTATKATLENAEKLVKRRQELVDMGGVSQEDLDDATRNLETAKANMEAAQAALVVAQDNLGYTKVFAPIEGIILTRIREPGTVVNASDPVYTLSVSHPVWIRAYVSEPDLGLVEFGMEAEIHTDTPNAPVYTGRIGFISPVAEFTPKTVQTTRLRTDLVYRLRIYVDNPDSLLKQGMPVTVKLKLQPKRSSE